MCRCTNCLAERCATRFWAYGRFDGRTRRTMPLQNALSWVEQGSDRSKGVIPSPIRGCSPPWSLNETLSPRSRAVREAVGDDVEMLIEVHGRLAPHEAIRMGNALEEFRPFWFEEPVPPENIDAMAKVSAGSQHSHRNRVNAYTPSGGSETCSRSKLSTWRSRISAMRAESSN